MKFRESTDQWFSDLIDYADKHPCPATQCLLAAVNRFPVKRNLDTVRYWIGYIKDTKLRQAILATINDLKSFGRGREFKFTYHTYPRWSGQCSACGTTFSLIRQALTYNN